MKNFLTFPILFFFALLSTTATAQDIFEPTATVTVIKSDTINLDSFKQLIVLPGGVMFRKYFEKINYFESAIDFTAFEKEIKKSPVKKEVGDFYGKDGLINAYNKYKKYLILFIEPKGKTHVVKMTLHKPDYGDLLIVEGSMEEKMEGVNYNPNHISDKTYNAFMNELVKYIRLNSKSYK